MTTSTAPTPAKRIFIFDNPRNRSHLFFRYLTTHPALKTHYHPYVTAGCLGPDKLNYDIYTTDPERARLVRELWEPLCQDSFTFASAERDMVAAVDTIEKEGKIPLVNEHCCYVLRRQLLVEAVNARRLPDPATLATTGNPTVLPDDLWRTVSPIIVIRHPALALPSYLRSMAGVPALARLDPRENHSHWFVTLAWSRLLFDVLRATGREPVVVDGEDVCTRTEAVGRGVCARLGLDPAGVSDVWEPLGLGGTATQSLTDLEHAHPLFKEMTRTIWESDGVIKHEVSLLLSAWGG